ncbi:FGGY-family carbohydrate kinase [Aestuariivirga sp.]|uniref:FGGY-family carbohydrate kinase n=1 Tax=Aestuariivirga sp. TaxID=2650926 RepID=UPI00391BBA77
MGEKDPRGIAVVDAGYTNTKIALFSPAGELVAERKAASRHAEGPPYRWIDPEPMVALCREALPELDRILPVDMIVPSAHGAAMACLDVTGALALPVMDYTSEPPPEIVAEYRKIMPGFDEAYCPLLPMALTHGLQLYWQQRMWPEAFSRVTTLLPWIQYVGFRLSGVAVTEISSMACQTHLLDVAAQAPSRMARDLGWDRLFAPRARAWERIGRLKPEFRGGSFRGEGQVLGGVHDSTANFMRYVCAGLDRFTLVSTGTWSISFDPSTSLDVLDPDRDTNTNTDVLGRNVCCSRFFGGKEFEAVAQGAPAEAAGLDCVARLVARGTRAVPSFTVSGGPVPQSGGRGRIAGPPPVSDEEKASLAALYCAQMVSEQLDAIASRDEIIVDGPFSQNRVLLALLAQLRPRQAVKASALRDGTTAGAAALALIADDGTLPTIALKLATVSAARVGGLEEYHAKWRRLAHEKR